jgi:putative tricarboxylic transport membrane protein
MLLITIKLNQTKKIAAILLIVIGILLSTKNNFAIPSWWIDIQYMFVDKTLFAIIVALFIIPNLFGSANTTANSSTIIGQEVKEPFPWWLSIKSSIVGFFAGVIPGPGTYTSSFIAYLMASDKKHKVIAAETANNAGGLGGTLPLLIAAIPTNQNSLLILNAMEIKLLEINQLIWETGTWGLAIIDQVLLAIIATSVACYFLSTNFLKFYSKVIEFFNQHNAWVIIPLVVGLCLIDIQASNVNPINYAILIMLFSGVGLMLKKYNINPIPLVFCLIIGDKIVWSFVQVFIIYF